MWTFNYTPSSGGKRETKWEFLRKPMIKTLIEVIELEESKSAEDLNSTAKELSIAELFLNYLFVRKEVKDEDCSERVGT